MSKIKSSGYAQFTDDELEFNEVGYYYYSKLNKGQTKEDKGKPDGEKSKSKKKNYKEERRVKRGE